MKLEWYRIITFFRKIFGQNRFSRIFAVIILKNFWPRHIQRSFQSIFLRFRKFLFSKSALLLLALPWFQLLPGTTPLCVCRRRWRWLQLRLEERKRCCDVQILVTDCTFLLSFQRSSRVVLEPCQDSRRIRGARLLFHLLRDFWLFLERCKELWERDEKRGVQ